MAKLAIQERLLPGESARERLTAAKALGISFVEFDFAGLDERLPAIAEAMEATGVRACGINMGRVDGWLSVDRARRDRAADSLREALTCAMDLEADYVTIVPQWGESDLPDLTPLASPMELGKQLLVWLLRGMSDLAETMEASIALLPVNRSETDFLTRLEQAAWFRRQVDDHPNIRLAAGAHHIELEGTDPLSSLRDHLPHIDVIYLRQADSALPLNDIADMLQAADYDGWLVLEARDQNAADLAAWLRRLDDAGLRH